MVLCATFAIVKKMYYEHIMTSDFLVLLFYASLFAFVLLFTSRFFQLKDKRTERIILAFFFIYNCLICFDYKFNFIPFLPDSSQYDILFKTGRTFEGMSRTLYGFLYAAKILRLLFLKNILVYISFQVMLYFMAIGIFYRAWQVLYAASRPKGFEQIYFVLALSLPSAFLYHLVPLRECFTTFGFSVSLYFLLRLFKMRKSINLGFFGGLFVIVMTRMQVAFYFIVGLVGVKFGLDRNLIRKFAAVLLGAAMFLGVLSLTSYKLSPSQLAAARNYRVEKYAGSYGRVEWNSYVDLIQSSPKLLAQFLVSPIPILHDKNAWDMQLILLDAFFMLFVWAILLFNIRAWFNDYRVWFLLMFVYIGLFGIYEFNIGGAVRHRLPLSIMAILVASQFLSVTFYSFKRKLVN